MVEGEHATLHFYVFRTFAFDQDLKNLWKPFLLLRRHGENGNRNCHKGPKNVQDEILVDKLIISMFFPMSINQI